MKLNPVEEFFGQRREPGQREFCQCGLGSGVVVDSDNGYVLTNHHVIKGADTIYVRLRKFSRAAGGIVRYINSPIR